MNKARFTDTKIVPEKHLPHVMHQPEYRSAVPLLTATEMVERELAGEPMNVAGGERNPERLYTVEMAKRQTTLDAPLAVGNYILHKSKLRNMRVMEFLKFYLIITFFTSAYCDTDR